MTSKGKEVMMDPKMQLNGGTQASHVQVAFVFTVRRDRVTQKPIEAVWTQRLVKPHQAVS